VALPVLPAECGSPEALQGAGSGKRFGRDVHSEIERGEAPLGHEIAIISDIHANYLALAAVLEEIDRLHPGAIICLGDIVGYGPRPVGCIDQVRRRCLLSLCGNHDFALVYGAEDFNPVAQSAIKFQRGLIMPQPGIAEGDTKRKGRWEFLKRLPHRHARGEWLFVHGSPRNPIVEYLRRLDVLLGMTEKIRENFELVDWLCFIGHTHRPGVITPDMRFLAPEDFHHVFMPQPHQKAIINVGSVGQSRDGDTRACFVTVTHEGHVHYHRVEYDVEAAAAQIESTPGLDPSLARRLREAK
jgi:diadenosine tetraphosphatase ApaH/serine/threonine PP2A family protein phosphatase